MLCVETHPTMPSDQHPAAAARSALRTKPPPQARPNPPFSRARDVPVHTFPDLGSHTRPHALPIWAPRRHARENPPRAGSTPAKPHQALRHGPTLHHKQPSIRNTTTTQKHHDTQHNTPNSPSIPHRRHQWRNLPPPTRTTSSSSRSLHCTNYDARHSDAQTKIAVHLSMAHVEHTNANVTGENVTAHLKDIGIAYYRKRNTFTVNVGPAVLKTINEKITVPFTITTREDVKYELQFAEIDYVATEAAPTQKNTIYKAAESRMAADHEEHPLKGSGVEDGR